MIIISSLRIKQRRLEALSHVKQNWVLRINENSYLMPDQMIVQFGFGPHNIFKPSEHADMCLTNVGNKSMCRISNRTKRCNFSYMIRSHFDDSHFNRSIDR